MAVGEVKGEVFFGSMDQVSDPGLTGAVFHLAIMGSIVEQEAAVFHGRDLSWNVRLRVGDGLFGFGGAGAFMAGLIDGYNGVAVCVAGLDFRVVEGWADIRLSG